MNILLRSETRKYERRTPLIPVHAAALTMNGVKVAVERSALRIYKDAEYADAGCDIVAPGSWRQSDPQTYILGIKELPQDNFALTHRHIYYADVFERPSHSALLNRFKMGGGKLYDYEYLVNAHNQQVASMSYWAGYCGAAIALMVYKGKRSIPLYFASYEELDKHLVEQIASWKSKPAALIIGAGGVAGRSVAQLLDRCQIKYTSYYRSDTESNLVPLDYDIIFNCAALKQKTAPFITNRNLQHHRNRLLIQDIACYLGSVFGNPLPIYDQITTFAKPVQSITPNVDLIAIDNLPSYLPRESSNTFSSLLIPHLLQLLFSPALKNTPWCRAEQRFNLAMEEMEELCA